MNKYISNSVENTQLIARDFADRLSLGSVICMKGDLGAGKTTFIQGVANALNFDENIVSPTFNILLQYRNSDGLTLNHFDLYRLNNDEELDDIAFYEIIEDANSISFIEWAEKFPDSMPSNSIELQIKKLDKTTREISY